LIVLFIVMIFSGVGLSPVQLLAIPWFCIAAIFACGLAMIMATLQLYFRDTASFLPYFTRIWLYISPVLWYADKVPHRLKFLEVVNPLFSICGGWSQILIEKQVPDPSTWLVALAWAFGSLLLGGYYFMSRERDFAVRL
jgi:teichoic acid transport system permease protein